MKRNEHIVPFSRDHHFGLLCAWKIRQGLKKEINPQRIGDYVVYFWDAHLEQHFKEEETFFFPYLNEDQAQRVKNEHEEIVQLKLKIQQESTVELLTDFADLLDQHIRYEEREWFPYLEQTLTEEQLAEIGKTIEKEHQIGEDNYEDVFWK